MSLNLHTRKLPLVGVALRRLSEVANERIDNHNQPWLDNIENKAPMTRRPDAISEETAPTILPM